MYKVKKLKSINVDKAWERLHQRLADEQLLNQTAKVVAMPVITKIKWVAAAVVLCVLGGTIAWYLNDEKLSHPLMSIHNSDRTNTLVKTLDDGSIVFLTSGATLTCPEQFADNKRQVSLHGEALFDIHSSKNRPFLIETEAVTVEVLGTIFNITTSGKESFELSVQHGTVKVTVKTSGQQTLVATGETVRLKDHQQLLKEPSAGQQQLAQYTEKMHFKDERLGNIIHVINKISDKPIRIAGYDLNNREITISFSNNTVEEMIELLCEVLELIYSYDGKEIIIGW